jgi:DNA-binding transcriptional regulator YiaG
VSVTSEKETTRPSELMQEKSKPIVLNDGHVRAARGLLNWTLADLSARSGISAKTIQRWESNQHRPTQETRTRIRAALEEMGIEFLNGGQPGVRLVGVKTET